MIDDMASLKQAMEQMDTDDIAASQAARDRVARILSDSNLNFSKMAELIEQRRLLLRPKILASMKRMDQPDMLGDAAFRDTGTSLRREGQSFRQIAEALELNRTSAPPSRDAVQRDDVLLNQMEMEDEPDAPMWPRVLTYVMRVIFYPLRHPIRTLVIATLAVMLYNTLHDSGRQVSRYVADVSAASQRASTVVSYVSWFFGKLRRPSNDVGSAPTPPAPIPSPSLTEASPSATPSPGPTVASAPPAATPTPQASPAAPPANEAAAPPASTPRPNTRSAPSATSGANNRPRTLEPHTFDDLMPTGLRRNSRSAGPCTGGAGGCYWGGTRY